LKDGVTMEILLPLMAFRVTTVPRRF
jgi:hypothetical protein